MIVRGQSCFERSNNVSVQNKWMLRLGPLVVYPVELTHSRGQHAPLHVRELVNERGKRDESQSVRHVS